VSWSVQEKLQPSNAKNSTSNRNRTFRNIQIFNIQICKLTKPPLPSALHANVPPALKVSSVLQNSGTTNVLTGVAERKAKTKLCLKISVGKAY
jgi:hypothetical protein